MVTLILTAHLSHLCIIMKTKNIVKASLFTLILAFMVSGMLAIGEVMKRNEVTTVLNADPTPEEWHFNGADDPEDNNPEDPSQYSKASEESCDDEVETVCKITAPADTANPSQPNLDYIVPGPNASVKNRIAQALSAKAPNETVQAFRSE